MLPEAEPDVELTGEQKVRYEMECQKRLRESSALVSGMNALGAEVTKNIIMGGIKRVLLRDDKVVTQEDLIGQFLVTYQDLGNNRAEASLSRACMLNPTAEISADTGALREKSAEFFAQFNVVIVIGEANDELLRIDNICCELGVKLLVADVWGSFGYYYPSIQKHSFAKIVPYEKMVSQPNEDVKYETVYTLVKGEIVYWSYDSFLDHVVNSSNYGDYNNDSKAFKAHQNLMMLYIVHGFRARYNRNPNSRSQYGDKVLLSDIRDELTPQNPSLTNETFEQLFSNLQPALCTIGEIVSKAAVQVVTKSGAPLFEFS